MINEYLDNLLKMNKIERSFQSHASKIETKDSTKKIKMKIFKLLHTLIDTVKSMETDSSLL